jgi:hypothetical protein
LRKGADKAACESTPSATWKYALETSKVTLLDKNSDLPGLVRLLMQTRRLRKLWQGHRVSVFKTAVNWVTKTVRKMPPRKVFERKKTVGHNDKEL